MERSAMRVKQRPRISLRFIRATGESRHMPVFTVHEPPRRDDKLLAHTARFQFVRDGFHFWAFLLAPLWMLRHRLWLEFIFYALIVAAITFALRRLGVAQM